MTTSNTSPGLSISGDSKLKIPLSHLLAVIGTLIGCTVTSVAFLVNTKNDTQRSIENLGIKVEINQERTESQFKSLRDEVQAQGRRAWLYEEQVNWTAALKDEFRRSEYNIPPAYKYRSAP